MGDTLAISEGRGEVYSAERDQIIIGMDMVAVDEPHCGYTKHIVSSK